MRRGVFSCYRPTNGETAPTNPARLLTTNKEKKNLTPAEVEKAEARRQYTENYLGT